MPIHFPTVHSDSMLLEQAARIASGDIAGNCIPFFDGLLQEKSLCLMAGLDYDTPWTRDASINTMNAMCMFDKDISKNTLLSVCTEHEGKYVIGGQYWDAVIWSLGAWQYLCVNNDSGFETFACDAICNSLHYFEETEFDTAMGLFRGAAVYGDGIAAYPDKYTKTLNNGTGIFEWPDANPEGRAGKGYGLPMFALSTNCVYYAAYRIAARLCRQQGCNAFSYEEKAEMLKDAINRNFWNEKTGRYDYLFDNELRCDHAEALGLSFSILFGVADKEKTESILKNTPITAHGIACVWPSFPRYRVANHYGRHSGTVWPHAQGYWALACLQAGYFAGFDKEFWSLSEKACRDKQFAEIYHPVTGMQYGGVQESTDGGIIEWHSCDKQTWSATAYWSLILYGLLGLNISKEEIILQPYLPEGIDHITVSGLPIDGCTYTISVDRSGTYPTKKKLPKANAGKCVLSLSFQ